MKFKRFACTSLACVALALPFGFSTIGVSAAYIETNGTYPPYGKLTPFGDMYASYGAFGNSDYQGTGSTDYPTFTLPTPLFYGNTDDGISDDVYNDNDLGILGVGDFGVFQRMDSGYATLDMNNFSTLWRGVPTTRPILTLYNYDDIHSMRNIWKSYLELSSQDISINYFYGVFTTFKVSYRLRNRYEHTWFEGSDTFLMSELIDYVDGKKFHLGEWFFPYLSDELGATNYIPLINGEEIPYPFGVESVVSAFFDFVDIDYPLDSGNTVRTHLPLSYYGSISFSFGNDKSVSAIEYAEQVRCGLGNSSFSVGKIRFTPGDLENFLEDKRYYSTSSNFQDSVNDAVKSIFSVPVAFFETPFMGNFTFGHLLIVAFGCLMLGVGLKISLGG